MTPNDLQFDTALGQAIAVWRASRRISVVLAAKLMEEGYDVPSLERAHRR